MLNYANISEPVRHLYRLDGCGLYLQPAGKRCRLYLQSVVIKLRAVLAAYHDG